MTKAYKLLLSSSKKSVRDIEKDFSKMDFVRYCKELGEYLKKKSGGKR